MTGTTVTAYSAGAEQASYVREETANGTFEMYYDQSGVKTQYTYTRKNGTSYTEYYTDGEYAYAEEWDDSGALEHTIYIQKMDEQNRATQLEYHDASGAVLYTENVDYYDTGDPSSVTTTYPGGRESTVYYTSDGYVGKTVETEGNVTTVEEFTAGRLTSSTVTREDNTSTKTTYDGTGASVTVELDADGTTTEYTYDDGQGNSYTYFYNEAENTTGYRGTGIYDKNEPGTGNPLLRTEETDPDENTTEGPSAEVTPVPTVTPTEDPDAGTEPDP